MSADTCGWWTWLVGCGVEDRFGRMIGGGLTFGDLLARENLSASGLDDQIIMYWRFGIADGGTSSLLEKVR